ncbi:MAG: hypothetical protein RL698_2820 [Pseudomonadota bacterium]|jgi:tetraacyldisaccharide 4'-kinase
MNAAGDRHRVTGPAVVPWERGGFAPWMLAPLGRLWGGVMRLRSAAYDAGVLRATRMSVPVVSIGNLSVGGTGKTPASLWLGDRLRNLGLAPAIVTRGYGGDLGGRILRAAPSARPALAGEGAVSQVGDEAVLLADRFPGPVVCGVDRVAAARHAIGEWGADVVVLDDGFQHRALGRCFDLVLVDAGAGFGNGAVLPAGPLREPLSALCRAGAIVVTKCEAIPPEIATRLDRHAPGVPVCAAALEPRCLVSAHGEHTFESPLADLAGRRVVAVSGLARPTSFYEVLDRLGAKLVEALEFRDHHAYGQADWQRIGQAARRADLVVCTEKDLVKLRRFPFARGHLFAVRVDFALAAADEAALLDRIVGAAGIGRLLRDGSGRAIPSGRTPAPEAVG